MGDVRDFILVLVSNHKSFSNSDLSIGIDVLCNISSASMIDFKHSRFFSLLYVGKCK